jgi:hypothetical protein
MKSLFVMGLLLCGSTAFAQHEHHPAPAAPAKSAEAGHHAFFAEERAALERGDGFGMAMAADRAGYPGPKHILELKEQLKLSAAQEASVNQLRAQMKEKAVPLGKEVLAAEARLEEMFRGGRPEAELREQTQRIAALRADLRWVHLGTHLAARKLLTAEQNALYLKLRHGS